jgi:6-pyruvoyltetrahydropterin/6-carboxytetrahydropterin synthase
MTVGDSFKAFHESPADFRITREIGIDMGHRVPQHASKCRNMHGHRYTIQATLMGQLKRAGSETDMVRDYGHVKDVMMREIDAVFDHALCLSSEDPLIKRWNLEPEGHHYSVFQVPDVGRVVVIRGVPTSERLAQLWYSILKDAMSDVVSVRVYETPNCWSDYPST